MTAHSTETGAQMDSKLQGFQQFITTQTVEISYGEFIFNLCVAFVLAHLVRAVYVRFGQSLSNRKRFGNNFPMLALTTMLIITIVKSSLALSLGLVGALSIVRFRAAVKDPEELAYLFLTIAVGLGLGASQTVITVIGTAVVLVSVFIRYAFHARTEENRNIFLTIAGDGDAKFTLPEVTKILKDTCAAVDLKRFDEGADASEAVFVVELDNLDKLEAARRKLLELNDSLRLTLLDQGVS